MTSVLTNARKSLQDEEPKEFVEMQRSLKEQLGFRNTREEEPSNEGWQVVKLKKTALNRRPVICGTEERWICIKKGESSNEPVKQIKPSTSFEARRDDLRLVLVDISPSSGRIDESTLMAVDAEIWIKVSQRKPEDPKGTTTR